MCPVIDYPTTCETCTVIHSIHAKNVSAAEIHPDLCVAYRIKQGKLTVLKLTNKKGKSSHRTLKQFSLAV
jgi:hypothetical protein